MLPAPNANLRQLREVLRSTVCAVRGRDNVLGLPLVRRSIVVLVDGLGTANLRARSGHARHLVRRLGAKDKIFSGFPTTTAASLASLTTGEPAGRHGLVGYLARNPATGALANQLSGWSESMDPATWQRLPTLFETAGAADVRSAAIGPRAYADSGFTRAVLRGADYVGAASIGERFEAAFDASLAGTADIVYLYVPELDQAGHARGSESPEWTAALEELDQAVGRAAAVLAPDEGLLVTADHGMVDIPPAQHVLIESGDLLDGVDLVGGEPRCLQLYFDPALSGVDRDRLAENWRASESSRAWVATRDEAIAAGWFGSVVDPLVSERIGDLLVAARKRVAYYDARDPRGAGRTMVGQHGSWTDEETVVPLLRFGAFAR